MLFVLLLTGVYVPGQTGRDGISGNAYIHFL